MYYLVDKYKKFIKFCFVGLLNSILDVSIFVFLIEKIKSPLIVSNTLSFFSVVLISFFLNKFWTFRNNKNEKRIQFIKFFLVSLIGLMLSNILLYFFVKIGVFYLLAKIIVIVLVVFWNFFVNNFWTFKVGKN
jgi:putative flippase GtrA